METEQRRMAEDLDRKITTNAYSGPYETQVIRPEWYGDYVTCDIKASTTNTASVTIGVDVGTGESYGAVVLSVVDNGVITIIGSATGRGPAFWLTVRAFLDAVRRRVRNVRIFGDE